MKLAVSVALLLSLGPTRAGWGRELGGLIVNAQDGRPVQGAEENTEQAGPGQKGEKKPLTNDDVMSMVKAGLAENTIVLAIQHSLTVFDTSPQALISLHAQGVPQPVLDAMLAAGSQKPTSPAGPVVPTPTQVPAKAPDLHTIRKIFLKTEWLDDDAETARKVIAIQKHTCLQVVETPAAADAILAWALEGLSGGALELRSKDGKVLWSKVGALPHPSRRSSKLLGVRSRRAPSLIFTSHGWERHPLGALRQTGFRRSNSNPFRARTCSLDPSRSHRRVRPDRR